MITMINSVYTTTTRKRTVRRAYQAPKLRKRGSVQQLTLKMGSISDGMGPHQ